MKEYQIVAIKRDGTIDVIWGPHVVDPTIAVDEYHHLYTWREEDIQLWSRPIMSWILELR